MSAAAEYLRSQLPDIGDGLVGAFVTLYSDPEPSRCESLAILLQGAARHVLALREALVRAGTGDDQCAR